MWRTGQRVFEIPFDSDRGAAVHTLRLIASTMRRSQLPTALRSGWTVRTIAVRVGGVFRSFRNCSSRRHRCARSRSRGQPGTEQQWYQYARQSAATAPDALSLIVHAVVHEPQSTCWPRIRQQPPSRIPRRDQALRRTSLPARSVKSSPHAVRCPSGDLCTFYKSAVQFLDSYRCESGRCRSFRGGKTLPFTRDVLAILRLPVIGAPRSL